MKSAEVGTAEVGTAEVFPESTRILRFDISTKGQS
jgi:hypothetical protein